MTRLLNLRLLIDEKFSGSQVDFSRSTGINPTQVNQWLNGYRALGEKSARKIESILGLKKYWLDNVERNKPATTKDSKQSIAFANFPDDTKELLEKFEEIKDLNVRKEIISYVTGCAATLKLNQAKKSRRHSSTSSPQKKAA